MTAVLDAARRMLHDAPGGVSAVALRMGRNATTLLHEAKGQGTAKLGLGCAVEASVLLQDHRVVDAWAQELGGVFVPLGYAGGCADSMAAMAACVQEAAGLCGALSAAMADGVVSCNELASIEAAADALVAVAHRIRGAARHNRDAHLPRSQGGGK